MNQNKHSRIYAAHFTENCIKQNLSVRRFLGSAFKSLRLALKRMQSQRLFDQKIKYGEECPPKNKSLQIVGLSPSLDLIMSSKHLHVYLNLPKRVKGSLEVKRLKVRQRENGHNSENLARRTILRLNHIAW